MRGSSDRGGSTSRAVPVVVRAGEGETIEGPAGGPLSFKVRGEQLAGVRTGSFVFVPRGTPHCFQNVGDRPARILVLFTPAGMERFFDRFAALPEFDPSAFQTLGSELGMDVIGPALGHP